MSVVVVGGGVIGAAIAHELTVRGLTVTVLEAGDSACSGATGSSFAWINANSKSPLWYQRLNHEGMKAWQSNDPYRQFLNQSGAIVYKEGSARAAQGIAGDATSRVSPYPHHDISSSDLSRIEPGAVLSATESATHFPSEGFADPDGVTESLLSGSQVCYGTTVSGFRKAGSQWVVLTRATRSKSASRVKDRSRVCDDSNTEGMEYRADAVVIAAGIKSASLLAADPIGYA